MIDSLYVAASGMHAQQTQIDVIANNLANVNTAGFKKSRVDFEDLMYRQADQVNADLVANDASRPKGLGAAVAATGKVFSAGDVKKTERELDFAIQGDGFFEVTMPDGSYAYSRAGSLRVDSEGFLVTVDGNRINPLVQIPTDADGIAVSADGTVNARLSGSGELAEIAKMELANFVNPSGLKPLGDNVYLPTHESGDAIYSTPGESGTGTVMQGYIEASNVQLVEELTNLMMAQRAYEINSKVAQASDELLGLVNNLRR